MHKHFENGDNPRYIGSGINPNKHSIARGDSVRNERCGVHEEGYTRGSTHASRSLAVSYLGGGAHRHPPTTR